MIKRHAAWPFFIIVLFTAGLSGCNSDGRPGLFSSMGYHVGKTKVWIKSPRSGVEIYSIDEVMGANPKTFYSKTIANKDGVGQLVGFDDRNVFWGADQIEGADIASFEYVGSEYFKDKAHGYHLANRLTEDVAHFQMYDEFAKDSVNVYFGSRVFSDDAPNFCRVGDLPSRYYKDSAHCWYFIYPISGADPLSLRYLERDWATDERHVFHQMNEIEHADPKTFEPLKFDFSRDRESVFMASVRIENADPSTFVVLSEQMSSDEKHCFYNGGILVDADPKTFHLIDEFYAKDSTHVWVNGIVIDGADPKTFEVTEGAGGKSKDAHYQYDMAERTNSQN